MESEPIMGSKIVVCWSSLPSFAKAKAYSPWRTRGLSFDQCFLRCDEGYVRCGELESFILFFLGLCCGEAFFRSGELFRQGESIPSLWQTSSLRRGEQTAAAQQLSLHFISSITLLDFPSNFTKHKQMED